MLSKVRMAVSFQEISVVTRNEIGRGIVRGQTQNIQWGRGYLNGPHYHDPLTGMMRSRSAQVKMIHLLRLINICIIFNCALLGLFT